MSPAEKRARKRVEDAQRAERAAREEAIAAMDRLVTKSQHVALALDALERLLEAQ